MTRLAPMTRLSTLRLLAGLLAATALTACPDPPPPADYQKPLAKPKEQPKTAPKPLPPMKRRKTQAKQLSAKELVQRECEQLYQQRLAAAKRMKRTLAKPSQQPPERCDQRGKKGKRSKRRGKACKPPGPPTIVLPDQTSFVETCARLPLDVVRCMNPRSRSTGALRCIDVIAKLSKNGKLPELLTKRRRRKRKRR